MTVKSVGKLIFLSCVIGIAGLFCNFFEDYIGLIAIVSVLLFISYKRLEKPINVPKPVSGFILLVLISALIFFVFIKKANPGKVLSLFLAALIVIRSFSTRSIRHYVQLLALSFLAILCGSLYNYRTSYYILLFIYTLVAGYALFKLHIFREMLDYAHATKRTKSVSIARKANPNFVHFFKVGILILILSSLVFAFIPDKFAMLPLYYRLHGQLAAITAFKNELDIGDVKFVLKDKTAVMRIKPLTTRSRGRIVYLRGKVFDTYIRLPNTWKWIILRSRKDTTDFKRADAGEVVILNEPRRVSLEEIKKYAEQGLAGKVASYKVPIDIWAVYYKYEIGNRIMLVDMPVAITTRTSNIEFIYDHYTNTIISLSSLPKNFEYILQTRAEIIDMPPAERTRFPPDRWQRGGQAEERKLHQFQDKRQDKEDKEEQEKKQGQEQDKDRTEKDTRAPVEKTIEFIIPEEGRKLIVDNDVIDTRWARRRKATIVDLHPYKAIAERILKEAHLKEQDSILAKANIIENYLKTHYRYSLRVPYVHGKDPILAFLLEHKTGYCEYFASAMALLLKSLGVETRIVLGYCGREYNEIGDYYVIRNMDAHTWVEVYIPRMGWVSFDPTPLSDDFTSPGFTGKLLKPIWDFLDVVQFKWFEDNRKKPAGKKPVNKAKKTLQKASQQGNEAAKKLYRSWNSFLASMRKLWDFVKGEGYQSTIDRVLHWTVEILVLITTIVVIKITAEIAKIFVRTMKSFLIRQWEEKYGGIWSCPVDFYRRFLFRLRKLSLARGRSETATEYAERLSTEFPEIKEKIRRITDRYLSVRFGGVKLSPYEQEEILKLCNDVLLFIRGRITSASKDNSSSRL